ncbi:MAG: FmdE family protein [Chloroflexi bacterium]|nr:FmdE family protein [Chloroflexota bacterium]
MTDQPTIDHVVEFHGHMCAGLAMGIRASEVALAQIGAHSSDEEVVAIVETDMCSVDAIQYLTGCTFGKGNLIHRDFGKNAYTFLRRSDGRALRISTPPGGWNSLGAGWSELLGRIRAGVSTEDERARFAALQAERTERILAAPLTELYDIREVNMEPPHRARILASFDCDLCGEPTMETRLCRLDGRQLCPPCLARAEAGAVPVPSPRSGPRPGAERNR